MSDLTALTQRRRRARRLDLTRAGKKYQAAIGMAEMLAVPERRREVLKARSRQDDVLMLDMLSPKASAHGIQPSSDMLIKLIKLNEVKTWLN